MLLDSFVFTPAGGRGYNEDAALAQESADGGLYLVADGLGGHAHSEQAAQAVIESLGKAEAPKGEEKLRGWLEAQIALLRPRVIVALGNTPLKWFLHSTGGITKMRGRWFNWRGVSLMPMFHPSYLLRNESREKGGPKDLTWRDIQEIRARYMSLQGKNDGTTV